MNASPREENAPSWLNECFLETALKKSFQNDELKILESEMKMATAVAEHYASQLFRFNLTLKTGKDGAKENLSVLVKLVLPGKSGEDLDRFKVYDKEESAFAVVLPAITELLKEAYPGHKKLWPDCYYHQKLPNFVLILEDLRVRDFGLASRFDGLDMEHSLLVLKSLAKLHAASLVLRKRNPEKVELYLENSWNPKNADLMTNMLSSPFKIMAKDILEWTECPEREVYSKKLKYLEEHILEKVFKTWEVDESKMNVLLHGDVWVNNIMFKYRPNGELAEMNFLDFQLMSVNNQVMDLQYFIFSSVSPDLRFDKIDYFLETYYNAFNETLKRLGHQLPKPFSLEQLKKNFEEKYFWGLTVLCVIFPIFLIPSNEAFHTEAFLKPEGNKNYEGTYKRKSLRSVLMRGFKFFEEKGVF